MRFQGAVIREQGVTFAIAVVRRHVIDCSSTAARAMDGFASVFPGMPIVLMAQDAGGRPLYRGRTDIARFLSRVPFRAIPWREYQVS